MRNTPGARSIRDRYGLNRGLHVHFGEAGDFLVLNVRDGGVPVHPRLNLGGFFGVVHVWPAVVFHLESGHCEEGVAPIDGPETRDALTRFRVEGDGVWNFTVGTLPIRDLINRVERIEGFLAVPVVPFDSFRRNFGVSPSSFIEEVQKSTREKEKSASAKWNPTSPSK